MTRTCCVEGCPSNAKDGRSLFRSHIFLKYETELDVLRTVYLNISIHFFLFIRITDRRRNWINIIREHQTLNASGKLYICELHFDTKFVISSNGKKELRKDAVPNIK